MSFGFESYDTQGDGFDDSELKEIRDQYLGIGLNIDRAIYAADLVKISQSPLKHTFFEEIARIGCKNLAALAIETTHQISFGRKNHIRLQSVWNSPDLAAQDFSVAVFIRPQNGEFVLIPVDGQNHFSPLAPAIDPALGLLWSEVDFLTPEPLAGNFTIGIRYSYRKQELPSRCFDFQKDGTKIWTKNAPN